MKITTLLAAGVAAGLLAGQSEAATVGFVATTTCVTNCAAAGLGTGEVVRTRLRVDDANFTPGGFLQNDDLVGFSASFGGSTLTRANAFGSSFFAEWGATAREITTFSLQAAATEAPTTGPAFGISDVFPTSFTKQGFCQNATCGVIDLGDAASGTIATISVIPVPPALLLSLTAIAGLVVSTRRKRVMPDPEG